MIKLLLVGVFNHGEIIWLNTKWSLRRLFGARIYTYGNNYDVMPSSQLIRYHYLSFASSAMIWNYSIFHDSKLNGKTVIYRYLGWNMDGDTPTDAACDAIRDAHERIFYDEVDESLR
jgi:hypothetical protein